MSDPKCSPKQMHLREKFGLELLLNHPCLIRDAANNRSLHSSNCSFSPKFSKLKTKQKAAAKVPPPSLSHIQDIQLLLLPAGRSLIAPISNSLLHSFGEILLKGHACKAACKAKGLYKINRDLNQPHLEQGQQNQAEARGAASTP